MIVLLTLVFILFEALVVPRKLARLPAHLREPLSRFSAVSQELQRYLLIKTTMSALIAIAIGLWVALLGVDFPVLCALIAFVCHFIPNIGAILAAAPAMLFAFIQFDLIQALVVGVGYLVIGTAARQPRRAGATRAAARACRPWWSFSPSSSGAGSGGPSGCCSRCRSP